MIPIKSNTPKDTCLPVSSDCVIWNGPDLTCIHLCKGDTITEVQYKAALVICDLKDQLNLSDLDIDHIFIACNTCPQPVKTLKVILELLINKIHTLEELIGAGSGSTTDTPVVLAACFRYTNTDGDLVTSLDHKEYTKKIGIQVCTVLTELANHQSTLDDHETRITTLETHETTSQDIHVNLVCVAPGATAETPVVKTVDDAVELLEVKFCQLKAIMGETTELASVLAHETVPAGSPAGIYKLSNPAQTLWQTAATTIAAALIHAFDAINDLRGAVKAIQDNCCQVTCDDIKIDFDIKVSDDRTTATVYFITKSHIPNGFADYNALGNTLTITDSAGAAYAVYVKIKDEMSNPSGFVIDLSGSALNTSLDYIFSMDATMTNGAMTCMKCVSKTATYKNTCSNCVITNTSREDVTLIYETSITATT